MSIIGTFIETQRKIRTRIQYFNFSWKEKAMQFIRDFTVMALNRMQQLLEESMIL